MKVNIEVDDQYKETSITIKTNKWTEELDQLVKQIQMNEPKRIFGIADEQTILLKPSEIDYVFAENKKVYAAVGKKQFEIKMRLFEVESSLATHHFMRFSKSVIGNLNNIQRFELAFNGNLFVHFQSGNKEYITRKYVASIKEKLTIVAHIMINLFIEPWLILSAVSRKWDH